MVVVVGRVVDVVVVVGATVVRVEDGATVVTAASPTQAETTAPNPKTRIINRRIARRLYRRNDCPRAAVTVTARWHPVTAEAAPMVVPVVTTSSMRTAPSGIPALISKCGTPL